jgi:hypothetical protein
MAFTRTTFESSGLLLMMTPKSPADNEETLHRCIAHAYQTICNCPDISERMRLSVMRRVKECIESCGGHFEHLL